MFKFYSWSVVQGVSGYTCRRVQRGHYLLSALEDDIIVWASERPSLSPSKSEQRVMALADMYCP